MQMIRARHGKIGRKSEGGFRSDAADSRGVTGKNRMRYRVQFS